MANSVRLTAAMVLACCLSAGCVADVDAGGRAQLAACYEAYAGGLDGKAIRHAGEFLRDNSPSVRDDEAYYLRGLALSRQGDGVDARADLLRATRSDRRAVRSRALLALGDLSLTGGDLGRAETLYRRSLSEGTTRKTPAQHAYLRLGHVLQRQGRWADADVQFSRVLKHFGGTKYARWAGGRIHGRAWTIRAGAFARRAGASEAAEELAKARLPASIEARLRGGRLMHVVSVGRYEKYGQVRAVLGKVRRVRPDAYIGVAK